MFTLGWTLALAVIIPPRVIEWGVGPRLALPFEPPLIGLAVGVLGLVFARWSHEPISRFAIAGVILNTLPLVLTILLHTF